MKISPLDKIRQQYQKHPPVLTVDSFTAARCPKCSSLLTIEDTEWFHIEMCEICFNHITVDDSKSCCNKHDLKKVKLICSNGTIQIKQQCTNCGDVSGNAIGGISNGEKDSLPILNNELRDSYFKRKSEQKSSLFNKYSAQRKDAWFQSYNEYLESPEWKAKRLLVLKRDKYLCQCCLDAYATQVHHKSYEFVDLKGNEPSFDLVSICVPCHEKVERMKKQK